jgi:predicted DNA-binding protein (UPF0251 family)
MPSSPALSRAEIEAINAQIVAGLSNAEIARQTGRSKQTIARVRAGAVRRAVTTHGKTINVRVTEDEFQAIRTVADREGLTVSASLRRLVRQATDRLDVHGDELVELAEARRELAAVGRNLNNLTKFAASGRLKWNARDGATLENVAARVDHLSEAIVHLVNAARRKAPISAATIMRKIAE